MRRKNLLLYVLGVFLFVLCSATQFQNTAHALTEAQRRVLNSGVYYFNTEASASNCGGASLLPGSNNEEKVWNFLVGEMGFTAEQAAGAMGNIQAESGFNPIAAYPNTTSQTPPGGTAWGLIQWTGGRQDALVAFAEAQTEIPSKDPADLGIQLNFMKSELEGPYKASVLDPLKAATTVEESTRVWLEHYEVPCVGAGAAACFNEEMTTRLPNSQNWLTQFGSGSSGSSSGNVTCGNSGQLAGGLSLPVDRHWYDEHPEWFTKPHHDYPASDIPVPTGTPVYSITAGTISSVTTAASKCGIGMTIDAGNGIRVNYCHSSDAGTLPSRGVGDTVNAGDIIMNSNDTGNSTGPHLHVGIYIDGALVCPQSLFVGIASGTPPDIKSLPTTGCISGHIGKVT